MVEYFKARDAHELADGKAVGIPKTGKVPVFEMTPEVQKIIDVEVEKRFKDNFEAWKAKQGTEVRRQLNFKEEDAHDEADRKQKERQKRRLEMLIQQDEKKS